MSADFLDTVISFLDPAVAVTLIDVAEEDSASTTGIDPAEEAKRGRSSAGVERARALGRHVDWRVARGEAGPEIVRDRRRRQVRRHLHEPARRLSPG